MEVGVIMGTGLSAQLNVVEEPSPGPEYATTQHQQTVVPTVRVQTRKLSRVTHKVAVILS